MNDPVNVTDPIRMVRITESAVSMGRSTASVCTTSHAATRAEASPPNPLKAATICGMEVILTRSAAQAPSAAPTATPATMVPQVTMLSAINVMTTAPSIPTPASRLPERAVLGPLIRLSPTMNAAEQPR
jgi:hypothetical protein